MLGQSAMASPGTSSPNRSRSDSTASNSSSSTTSSTSSSSHGGGDSSFDLNRREYTSTQFTLLEELGSGSFGVVYKAIDKYVIPHFAETPVC